jgi:homocysteine S-methyltransferase
MIARQPFVLFEGAVIERLRRLSNIHLDPDVLHAAFIYDPTGRAALERIYRRYLEIGQSYDLAMTILTPTWRASSERVRRAGWAERNINGDGFRFLHAVRESRGDYASRVSIGGLMGCRGDAYRPEQALSSTEAQRYHTAQAAALSIAGVDLLLGSTLPALSEALGMAKAMAGTRCPYMLSFVIRPAGTLLDGTPLHRAIAEIDASTDPPPLAYMVNCVHPAVFEQAFRRVRHAAPGASARILGLQANTSVKPPEELDNAASLQGEDPDVFADAMVHLYTDLGIRALGGCCGTDDRHIAAIAARVAALAGTPRYTSSSC